MKGRRAIQIFLVVTVAAGSLASPSLSALPKPSRLVVDNRSKETVQLDVWHYSGTAWSWKPLGTIKPGYFRNVYDVRNGQRFRATLLKSKSRRYHTVRLSHNSSYGGEQDVWIVR